MDWENTKFPTQCIFNITFIDLFKSDRWKTNWKHIIERRFNNVTIFLTTLNLIYYTAVITNNMMTWFLPSSEHSAFLIFAIIVFCWLSTWWKPRYPRERNLSCWNSKNNSDSKHPPAVLFNWSSDFHTHALHCSSFHTHALHCIGFHTLTPCLSPHLLYLLPTILHFAICDRSSACPVMMSSTLNSFNGKHFIQNKLCKIPSHIPDLSMDV